MQASKIVHYSTVISMCIVGVVAVPLALCLTIIICVILGIFFLPINIYNTLTEESTDGK